MTGKIATLPLTSLGAADAAVVDGLRPAPAGVEVIPCADDALWRAARSRDITASTLGALFRCHEFYTAYSLFQHKTGAAIEDAGDNDAIRRGRLMERVAIDMLREDHPDWIVRHNDGPGRRYYRDPEARLGATPDAECTLPDGVSLIVQIKSVAAATFRRKWLVDGEVTPPQWIILQALAERELTGADRCAVAPLVINDFGGIEMPLIEIPLDRSAAIMARARKEVREFWRRVAENDPPEPDYARDGDIVRDIYADDDGGEIILADNERAAVIIAAREELKKREADGRDAENARKVYDAELIHMLGNAARGRLADGRVVEAKTVKRGGYQVKPSSYRTIKVKEQK